MGVLIAVIVSLATTATLAFIVPYRDALAAIGISGALIGSVLLLPVAPIVLILAAIKLGAIPAIVLSLACCIPALVIARRAIRILESQGTDKFDAEIDALHRVVGVVLLEFSYIVVGGMFAVVAQYYPG